MRQHKCSNQSNDVGFSLVLLGAGSCPGIDRATAFPLLSTPTSLSPEPFSVGMIF